MSEGGSRREGSGPSTPAPLFSSVIKKPPSPPKGTRLKPTSRGCQLPPKLSSKTSTIVGVIVSIETSTITSTSPLKTSKSSAWGKLTMPPTWEAFLVYK